MSGEWVYSASESMRASMTALNAQSQVNRQLGVTIAPAQLGNVMQQGKSVQKSLQSGMRMTVGSAAALGLLTEDGNDALNKIRAAMLVTEAGFALYTVYHSMAIAQASLQTALAAAETIVHAAVMDWSGIAAAGIAAAAVIAAFEFASGTWTLPSVDISSASQRREASRQLATTVREG